MITIRDVLSSIPSTEGIDFEKMGLREYPIDVTGPFKAAAVALALRHYAPQGKNSWEHIERVYSQAQSMVWEAVHRPLTLKEHCAIMFHDCAVRDHGKKDHAAIGSRIAAEDLKGILSPEDLAEVVQAIAEHDDKVEHSSTTADVLASGDFNPPDPEWVVRKAWHWCKTHQDKAGTDIYDWLRELLQAPRGVCNVYGSRSKTVYPRLYKQFFGPRIAAMQKFMDTLTVDMIFRIVGES